jgi:hypothetical protein
MLYATTPKSRKDDTGRIIKTPSVIDDFCGMLMEIDNATRAVHYHIDRTPVPGDMFATISCQKGTLTGASFRNGLTNRQPIPADGRPVFEQPRNDGRTPWRLLTGLRRHETNFSRKSK